MSKGKGTIRSILVLPDLHFPWADQQGVEMAHRWAKKHKPDLIVQLGDITDQKMWSRWPTDPDDMSPHQEFEAMLSGLQDLSKRFPKMVILSGNHDRRLYTKAAESKLPTKMLKTLQDLVPARGWDWRLDPRKKLIVPTARGNVLFLHGDESGGTPLAKAVAVGTNVCMGHTHKTSITYRQTMDKFVWGFEAGHLMDVESKAADYAAASPVGAACGFGVIKYGVPYWLPADGGDV